MRRKIICVCGDTAKGRYYLEVPNVGRSIVFKIGSNVYDFALYAAVRAFYL
jgi:hypothetical protein